MRFFINGCRILRFYLIFDYSHHSNYSESQLQKVYRFFTGLILIVMLSEPIMKAIGMQTTFSELYHNASYQQKIREIEEATKYLEGMSLEDVGKEETDEIEVEEIQIEN